MLNCSYKIVLMEVIKVNFSIGYPLPAFDLQVQAKNGTKSIGAYRVNLPRSANMRG